MPLGRPLVETRYTTGSSHALTHTLLSAPFPQSSYTGRTDFRNPNSFTVLSANQIATDMPAGALLGESFSYGWWIVTFQLFATLYAAYVVVKAPAKRAGATALLAVLTTSTFLMTQAVYTAYGNGLTSFIINPLTGKNIKPTTKLTKVQRSAIVYFAGLIIVDVANCFAMITIADGEDAATPAAAAAEPVKDVEAAGVEVAASA